MRVNKWLNEKFLGLKELHNLRNFIQNDADNHVLHISGVYGSFFSYLAKNIGSTSAKSAVIICRSDEEAKLVFSDFQTFQTESAYYFPPLSLTPYQLGVVSGETASKRLETIRVILSGKKVTVVTSLEAVSFTMVPKHIIAKYFKTIRVGDHYEYDDLARLLVNAGYERVKQVVYPGEFAIRGEIVDIYYSSVSSPVRLEFFDTQIEKIRLFNPDTQKCQDILNEIILPPFREILYDSRMLETALTKIAGIGGDEDNRKHLEEQLKSFLPFDGEHFYQRLLYEKYSLLDYFEDPVVVFNDFDALERRESSLFADFTANYEASYNKYRPKFQPEEQLFSVNDLTEKASKVVYVDYLQQSNSSGSSIHFPMHEINVYSGDLDIFKNDLKKYVDEGYTVCIFVVTETQCGRLSVIFQDFNPLINEDDLASNCSGKLFILPIALSGGFIAQEQKVICMNDCEIFGKRTKISKHFNTRRTEVLDSFIDLKPGDYVVHIHHGIGLFTGIERVKSQGVEKDYIGILYADDDKVFIPVEQMNFIQKYISADVGNKPRLDKIGKKNWSKTKSKVKESVDKLAEELVRLYSYRLNQRGFAFAPDTPWQKEFEAKFPYDETEDQILTIEEVKRDMESTRPMDRLICGDVGFGKTEVAIRAAFKAVMSGKQVAILVPTTILTEQHYKNFKERLIDYPIKIEMLSRFRTAAEQRRILADLVAGELDIIIGTHRLLSKDVKYKNLGLLIIDEEHRFGVKHKEQLKQMRMNLDSISMTATPIPRSLHMSMAKIRDMSVINTPPRERIPVETYVMEFNQEILKAGIENELARGGQIFFLYNRIKTIYEMAKYLEQLVPQARIVVAHGQMEAEELEDIIHYFIEYKYDILLTTTIIESGIDIPRANTIFIDRADHFGLAQLYQLRGRVGRSNLKAYAYLFYDGKHAVNETAMKKLRVISEYTELGSGFKIAMKDMEIRGAGNLLGPEQHGDILAVGFSMYCKLLSDAVREIQKKSNNPELLEELTEPEELYLDIKYTGFIPDSYILDPKDKIEIYKKISGVTCDEDLTEIKRILSDRYGRIPQEVERLLYLGQIRIICRRLGICEMTERITETKIETIDTIKIKFSSGKKIDVAKLMSLMSASKGKIFLKGDSPDSIYLRVDENLSLEDKGRVIVKTIEKLE